MTESTIAPATGTFAIEGWKEEPYDDAAGTSLARVTMTKHYEGALRGTGTTTLLTVHSPAGPAAYVGIERFTGTLHGREGSVVLRHSIAEPPAIALLVPSTGTGAFENLAGTLTITIAADGTHHYTLSK